MDTYESMIFRPAERARVERERGEALEQRLAALEAALRAIETRAFDNACHPDFADLYRERMLELARMARTALGE